MNVQHFFLSSAAAAVPERWREAFPDGQALAGAALQSRLGQEAASQCLVWLSSTDTQWSDYLRQILQVQPGARVVLLSSLPATLEGLNALNQGVRGYTHAYGVPELLQEVALVVQHGGLWLGPDLLQRLVGASSAALAARAAVAKAQTPAVSAATLSATPGANSWALLSVREAEVARAVAAGRSNKEVADLLFISERTVKAHLGAVFEKLGVRDRLQLVLRLASAVEPGSAPTSESAA